MRKLAKYVIIALMLVNIFIMTGCDIELFEDKNAKYQLKPVERGYLADDKYYVKDGTKFYVVHKASMSSEGTELSPSKCAWTIKDDTLIPSYYSNELIAQSGKQVRDEALVLERYKDCGYSVGIHGAVYEDGYLVIRTGNNVISDSSAYEGIYNKYSENIMIESINGIPVTENMINEAGIITGLEKDAEYEITFFAGTYYGSCRVKADTHFLQSYEIYKINDFEMTKNGYVSIKLPEDLKTGYYRIDGSGFFKYYNFKKSEGTVADVDYNEPYYLSDEDQLAAFSQQFTFNLDAATKDMRVHATFEPKSVVNTEGIVTMMVTSPDGKRMTVKANKEDGEIICDMQESSPGKWVVNISPQNMTVTDVQVESNESQAEATTDVFTMTFDEAKTGIVITATYEGDGIVNAQIVGPDNQSYDMIPEENEGYNSTTHTLKYSFAYLPAGEYKINVHHYPDTKMVSTDYYLSEDVKEIDIIEVEE